MTKHILLLIESRSKFTLNFHYSELHYKCFLLDATLTCAAIRSRSLKPAAVNRLPPLWSFSNHLSSSRDWRALRAIEELALQKCDGLTPRLYLPP